MTLKVPAVLERLKKAIEAKISAGGLIKKTLFEVAFHNKLMALKMGTSAITLDKILFSKVSNAVVGKRLRLIVSGGALLNSE